MNSDTLYRTLYLLENDIARLDEALDQQKIDSLTTLLPSATADSIIQLHKQNNDNGVMSQLNSYLRTAIGKKASSIDDAIKILKQDKSEITSITNILLRASMPKDQVDKMTSVEKRRTLNTLAEKSGISTKGKPTAEVTSALSNVLAVKKASQDKTTSASGDFNRTKNSPAPTEPFPGKRQIFINNYKKTLALGWPGEPIKVKGGTADNPEIEQTVGKLIPFNVGAKIGTKLTNAIPGTKVLPLWIKTAKNLVYNKFKQDPTGLKKLLDAVNDIIEKNNQYKLSKRVGFRDVFKSLGNSFLAKFGASDKDLAVFNWLVTKAVGMDIFEFQKLILEEVMSAIDMTDERLLKMENVAKGLKRMFERAPEANKFSISSLKSSQSYDGGYKVWYVIKSNVKPPTTSTIASPMEFYLRMLEEYVKSPAGKKWTEVPSEKDIRNEQIKLRDYSIGRSKEKYSYDDTEDGPLSCVDEEKQGDKLIGKQFMYPVFLERNGLYIYVTYNPEREE